MAASRPSNLAKLAKLAGFGAILLVLGVVSAIFLRSARIANAIIHPTRRRVTPEEAQTAASELAGLEEVALHTSDGLTLRGWLSPGTGKGTVILVHGLFGNRASLLTEAIVISRHGYGVLLYDSRASGDSDGDLATWGDREQRDIEAAIDTLRADRRVDPERIALLGFSVGASAVALTAARDTRVKAVVLYACWTSLEREIKRNHAEFGPLSWGTTLFVMRRAGIRVDAVDPVDHIAQIAPRPLFMLAGEQDDDTPPTIVRELYSAARLPKDLWFIPEAHHGGYVQARPAEYEARVVQFLDRSFAPPP